MLFSSLVVFFLFCSLIVLLTILHLGKGKSKTSKKKSSSRKSAKKSGRGRSSSGGGRLSRDDAEDTKGCCCLCWALCCIFCCPPVPSSIVSKLAFHPPSSSSYTISGNDTSSKKGASGGSFKPKPSAGWPFSSSDLGNISAFTVKTASGNKVACMFVPGESSAKYTLLFSHGNASDLGQMASLYFLFSRLFSVNIFSYDYEGYGASSGKPSEGALYEDIDAAYKGLVEKMSIPAEKIILYGQSIGSAPTIHLAARTKRLAGVVIQSGLASACQVFCPFDCCQPFGQLRCNSFPNETKIAEVEAPVLVIHGTSDEVISVDHGIALYKAAPKTVDPCWVHGAHHNDVVLYTEVHRRLEKFIIQVEQVQENLLEL